MRLQPFETLSTRTMTDKENQGAVTIARTIWREKGLLGFYEGWEAYPFLSLKPALQETIIDQTRIAWLRWVGRAGLKGSEGFLLGGWGRIVTTLIMVRGQHSPKLPKPRWAHLTSALLCRRQYPLFKVRLLIASGNMEGLGVAGTVAAVVKTSGIAGLYRGMGPEMVRSTVYQSCLTGTKELLDAFNRSMISLLIGSGG